MPHEVHAARCEQRRTMLECRACGATCNISDGQFDVMNEFILRHAACQRLSPDAN